MATKTLTNRSDEAAATPVEAVEAKSGYTGGCWAVRGGHVELSYDAEENLEEVAMAIVEAEFQAAVDREISKIAGLPPFLALRKLRERIAEAEVTINTAREKIAEMKKSLGPDASATELARVRKGLDECELGIRQAVLEGENARRFTADAFAKCQGLARESLPALLEMFRDRAENYKTHLGDQFWAVARDYFVKMAVSEHQAAIVSGYLQQVMSSVDLILEPEGWEAAMVRLLPR